MGRLLGWRSIYLSVYLSISLSSWLSVCLSVCPSVRRSVGLSVSVCLSVCLPACLSVCLSVSLLIATFKIPLAHDPDQPLHTQMLQVSLQGAGQQILSETTTYPVISMPQNLPWVNSKDDPTRVNPPT